MDKCKEVERSIITKFRPTIWRLFLRGIDEYKMISEGDKIAVCVSGGKDSMLLAKCMQELLAHGDVKFELKFIAMDPGYNEVNRKLLEDNAKLLNVPLEFFETNIFDVVENIKESPCYLCARMRRGHLYSMAKKLGCNKIALGHHFDDVIETILMGMLYGSQVQTMMPKLHSTNFPEMELIRPLYLVKEKSILHWAKSNELKFLRCACKFTLERETKENSKRQEIKELIDSLRKVYPNVDINIFRSVHDVNLNTLIGYHNDTMRYNFLDDYDSKKQKIED